MGFHLKKKRLFKDFQASRAPGKSHDHGRVFTFWIKGCRSVYMYL